MNDQDKRRIFGLNLEGVSYAKIAEQVGISRQRVQQIIKPPSAIAKLVRDKANGRCEECGTVPSRPGEGHIHHRNSAETGIEQFNDTINLQYLCRSCHRKVHAEKSAIVRQASFRINYADARKHYPDMPTVETNSMEYARVELRPFFYVVVTVNGWWTLDKENRQ